MSQTRTGTGKGGKSFQDRKLAAEVRTLALNDIKAILTDDPKVAQWSDYKRRILEKLSTTVLPRLNEHTGEDGDPIKHDISSPLDKIYGRGN